ncbi:hypothetical protein H2248_011239 [Termitomyces sp. 'cryptogamus']|nr:hypothetical protein H2248_011239 [Termitomyces sp. 'cryptogamus']
MARTDQIVNFQIVNFKVVYSDTPLNASPDRVLDWFKGSDDINNKFGSKYVWIVPEITTQVSEALTKFELVIMTKAHPGYDDLSKGARGDYRYLVSVKQSDKYLLVAGPTLARIKSNELSPSSGQTCRKVIPVTSTGGEAATIYIWYGSCRGLTQSNCC